MHTVRCPACLGDVGVEDADFGHAVACPLCGDVFTPTRPAGTTEPAAAPDRPPDDAPPDRPSRRSRFEDDEDEGDYDLERPSRGRPRSRVPRPRAVDIREAEDLVQGPATGLMVTAGLGFAMSAVGLVVAIVITVADVGPGPGAGPGAAPPGQGFVDAISQLAGALMGLATSSVILVGAMRMKKLQSHTFGVVAAVIALLPCVSPCCIVGLPIGIWALTTLNKPEVKDAFRAVAERGEE